MQRKTKDELIHEDPLITEIEALMAQVATLPPPQIAWTPRPDPRVAPREPGNAWVLGMRPWLVTDGAYGTLARGREIDFALRCEPIELAPGAIDGPAAWALGNDVYRVHARVLRRNPAGVCVLDFGVLAYLTDAPEWMHPGAAVAGEVALGPDTDAYRAGHWTHENDLSALIYPWRLDRIVVENAARVPATREARHRCDSPALMTNDAELRTLREVAVARPDVDWRAGDIAHYHLHCTLLSRIPREPDARDEHPRFRAPLD